MPKIFDQETKWNVYHYTDTNALISILAKEKIILRATDIMYLNDPHELIEGITTIQDIQKNIPQSRGISQLLYHIFFIL